MDLIDRQAAIDEIKSVYEWHDTVTMERLIEHLNNLPSADMDLSNFSDKLWRAAYERGKAEAERHGKWISKNSTFKNRWLCSVCVYTWYFDTADANYCPHCGARMDEVKQ